MSGYRGKQEKKKEGGGMVLRPGELVKGIKGEGGRAGKQAESASRGEPRIENGRTQLSLHPAPTPRPLIQAAAAEPSRTTVASPPGCFSFVLIHSIIHPFIHFLAPSSPSPSPPPQPPSNLLGRSKPNQLSSVGPGRPSVLVPVSAGLSNSPALISQLLQIKREVSGYYSKPLR